MTGTVYKSTGSWYTVKTSLGATYDCRIKGKFRIKGIKSTNPIAVGDQVDFELETHNDQTTGVIHNIHDRSNYIVRKSVKLSKQTHIIASNIDQVFLLITINNPPTFTSFIDRFLVTAEAYSVKTILLFNKIDTYSEELLDEVRYLAHVYRKIGYECIGVSAQTGKNVDKVKALMVDKVSMFAGHSGVGKSTLVNAIEPELDLKTKAISIQHSQGQHTTTFAEMFDLSFGARIIDTPGIKGFGVVDMDKEEVGDYFPEFFELKQYCKFNNCLHVEEPKCAVKAALDNDEIAYSRYRSYRQILDGEDEHYRTDNFEDY
ncbi:ribosome small subunit-dependent GTPase A [Psychroserpens sp.]|uniref:ribosome small subunit-dependent GTPase A n=1 Tax=Psychroserpens sp. TaxID=2020870 RepID=UPI001B231FF5|nr:ribosome small subunit-dependent GTPase A [Psychroserpens sp.]MBO6607947.1 ribosome small subunit-dependent GTPase A [Psychroserpens sp.]MBO6631042.1 ribosome small subunit-dependent GTPase A [Psychroserpens sp.]MBO6654926.1 ribosome small subunit-dependent GTPase A [Psychroserpens sp.]MBO6683000.1 ribosome small subunit-dependent GTPase A [Psychroserpens sp.]MBO6751305.1 ribosome small subunit-dependent GTPase A [Psychroserpens sp.]